MRILLAVLATSGLFGHVSRGPTTPVCTEGTPCSAPVVGARLEFLRKGVVAGSVRTNAVGAYRISLVPGLYAVRIARATPLALRFGPPTVRVRAGRPLRADFSIDTGIR
jgi:hypothetical protein